MRDGDYSHYVTTIASSIMYLYYCLSFYVVSFIDMDLENPLVVVIHYTLECVEQEFAHIVQILAQGISEVQVDLHCQSGLLEDGECLPMFQQCPLDKGIDPLLLGLPGVVEVRAVPITEREFPPVLGNGLSGQDELQGFESLPLSDDDIINLHLVDIMS